MITAHACRTRRRTVIAGVALIGATLCTMTHAASAQQTHVLIVQGLSGEMQYRRQFDSTVTLVRNAARQRWNVADSNVAVLSEEANAVMHVGKATREAVGASFLALSRRVRPGDIVLVMLLGHGSGEGAASKVNLPGVDATAADFAAWIGALSRQSVVFVNAATGSGDFVSVLQGPGRIIITATRSAMERNESVFAPYFAAGLAGSDADADKDGRVSVLEAFRYARKEVARVYESSNRLQTEHAQLSDSTLAARIAFGGAAASTDPRVVALMAERQALEADVAALRAKKASMAVDAYDRELERLLLALAEKTQAIRAAGARR